MRFGLNEPTHKDHGVHALAQDFLGIRTAVALSFRLRAIPFFSTPWPLRALRSCDQRRFNKGGALKPIVKCLNSIDTDFLVDGCGNPITFFILFACLNSIV